MTILASSTTATISVTVPVIVPTAVAVTATEVLASNVVKSAAVTEASPTVIVIASVASTVFRVFNSAITSVLTISAVI